MNYPQWVEAVCALLEYQVVDPSSATPTDVDAFNAIIPRAIEYTELRMQRDLDFIATTTVNTSGTMTANSRTVTLPVPSVVGAYVVVSQIRPIIGGVRQQPLEPVTRSFLDFVFPNEASLGASYPPVYWTPNDQTSVIVGPAPSSALSFEVLGTTRFAPMSSTNVSNFMSQYLPDLYLAASMIFLSGYQRDFGAQADDPKMALSWEKTYTDLLSSAVVEEARKRYSDMFPHATDPAGTLTSQSGG